MPRLEALYATGVFGASMRMSQRGLAQRPCNGAQACALSHGLNNGLCSFTLHRDTRSEGRAKSVVVFRMVTQMMRGVQHSGARHTTINIYDL